MDDWTNIRISRKLHKVLEERGKKSETFDETITRLIGEDEDYKKDVM
jgi:hypothetical protein